MSRNLMDSAVWMRHTRSGRSALIPAKAVNAHRRLGWVDAPPEAPDTSTSQQPARQTRKEDNDG